jgi:hypothetical protein
MTKNASAHDSMIRADGIDPVEDGKLPAVDLWPARSAPVKARTCILRPDSVRPPPETLMRIPPRVLALAALFGCSGFATRSATAHTWTDPWFDEAVREAALIAIAHVDADDATEATIRIERVFAGEFKADDVVRVWHGDELRDHAGNGFASPGERQLFILRAGEEGAPLRTFTDSYWVFPVEESRVRISLRDPFAGASVPIEAFGAIVSLVRADQPDPESVRALVDPLLAAADKTEPSTTVLDDVEAQVLAMETLCKFGSPEDLDRIVRFFESPYFQVRVSCARAISGCGGPTAVAALCDQLEREEVAAVQSTIGMALERLASRRQVDAVPPQLVAFVPGASKDVVALKSNLMDGRSNSLPSPRESAIVAVMRIESEAGTWDELAQRAETYWEARPR